MFYFVSLRVRCYNGLGFFGSRALPDNPAVIPLFQGVILLCPLSTGKGGDKVNAVTYEELFQLLLVLIAFASLIFQITKKK